MRLLEFRLVGPRICKLLGKPPLVLDGLPGLTLCLLLCLRIDVEDIRTRSKSCHNGKTDNDRRHSALP